MEVRTLQFCTHCQWSYFECRTDDMEGNSDKYVCTLGHPVAPLVEALRYNLEGRGFDSRCCHRNFSLT